MPYFVLAIVGVLIEVAATIVGRVLIALGLGYVTYTGIDTSLAWASSQFLSGMSGLPAAAVGLANTLKIGVCTSMLLSAITVRLTLSGLTSGSIKRLVQK